MFSASTSSVLEHESFFSLKQHTLSTLLDVDSIDIVEATLFFYIKKWMKKECLNQGLDETGENMRNVLGDALYKIRFPTMNGQDFANCVATIDGFLSESETAQIFRKIMVLDNENIVCPFSAKFRCHKPSVNMFQSIEQYCSREGSGSVLRNVAKMNQNQVFDTNSLRLVMQCCADLQNSHNFGYYAYANNKAEAAEALKKFDQLVEMSERAKFNETMAQYSEFCKSLNKTCAWSL